MNIEIYICRCKSGCGKNCGCRKTGLFCTKAFTKCSGDNCTNCPPAIILDDDEIEGERTAENS